MARNRITDYLSKLSPTKAANKAAVTAELAVISAETENTKLKKRVRELSTGGLDLREAGSAAGGSYIGGVIDAAFDTDPDDAFGPADLVAVAAIVIGKGNGNAMIKDMGYGHFIGRAREVGKSHGATMSDLDVFSFFKSE